MKPREPGAIQFKYGNELASYDNCPGDVFDAEGPVYRWVHEGCGPESFRPVAVISDARDTCCNAWALSLYQTEEQARVAFRGFERRMRNFRKRVGGFVARGSLSPSDGKVTTPNGVGHIDFFEFQAVDVWTSFAVVGQL